MRPRRKMVDAQEAFIVTVGVPHEPKARAAHCARALTVLSQAGYRAGATSGEAILALAEQERLNRELDDNDPPEAA
jgi:hypothetical protein